MATKLTQLSREDFRQVSNNRLNDANALFSAGCWVGAYYLAGYSVERVFKACIAKDTRAEYYPPSDGKDYYTHNFAKLLSLSGLALPSDPEFQLNWKTVVDWTEEKRYAAVSEETKAEAEKLLGSITDPAKGVLHGYELIGDDYKGDTRGRVASLQHADEEQLPDQRAFLGGVR